MLERGPSGDGLRSFVLEYKRQDMSFLGRGVY